MNERIQELMKQAGTDVSGKWMGVDHATKFAELIVKECAKFLEDNSGYGECNDAWHPEPEELLEHFGVNE
jgi:hypothetical protein